MPSAKFQTNPKHKVPNSKWNSFGSFGFGIWNLFGLWDLEIGI
jgi:hypothetical protein